MVSWYTTTFAGIDSVSLRGPNSGMIMEDRKFFSLYFKPAIAAGVTLLLALASQSQAQTIYEIWKPTIDNQSGQDAFDSCFFRKQLSLVDPTEAEIYLSAKDDFELYVNDQPIGNGQSLGRPVKFDVSSMLRPGVNVIAFATSTP